MKPKLINSVMADGSHHFDVLPQEDSWFEFTARLEASEGLQVTQFLSDKLTEGWLIFYTEVTRLP